jgi:adenine-specific DNA-methyltransferase
MTTTREFGEPVHRETVNVAEEQLARLKELFPETFAEGQVDFEKLRATLGDLVDDRPERYTFTWAGKRDAIRLLQTPTRATLVPCREESVNFDETQHVFIEGDNLEVLKLLYKPYFGRVKMIYIDPPYNTGNDFIYPDNFADPLATYLQLTGQQDAEGTLLTSNPETSGRYHSAWLSMMYPRLFLARQLLREDGVIFVSIDDHEVHNLRLLMNEVFGEENFIATVIWQKVYSPKNTAKHFSEDHDYALVYARSAEVWRPNLLPRTAASNARYDNPDSDPRGPWKSGDLTARNYYSEGQYEVVSPAGKRFRAP